MYGIVALKNNPKNIQKIAVKFNYGKTPLVTPHSVTLRHTYYKTRPLLRTTIMHTTPTLLNLRLGLEFGLV